MNAQFDVSTLNWIKGEIDDSLNQARVALEAFLASPEDETHLKFCVMHLHQVHGTLQMVELQGAAHLAEEMEQLALALQQAGVRDREQACEVLMRAMLQLPDYLEALQGGQSDNALVLLPLINELRHSRNATQTPVGQFFRPDLSCLPPPSVGMAGDIRLLAQKARPHYQAALLKLLRGTEVEPAVRTLGMLADKLLAAATLPALRQWWWVFGGLVEILAAEDRAMLLLARPLLSKGEQLLKALAEGGEAAVVPEPLADVVTTMLFHIARGGQAGGDRAQALREAFQLDRLLGGAQAAAPALGGFNAALKQQLATDLLEELATVQDSLDVFASGSPPAASELAALADTLARLAATLTVMEQEALQQALSEQVAVLRGLLETGQSAGEDVLMNLAGVVLAVESTLRDWGTVRPLERADEAQPEAHVPPQLEAEHQRIVRQVMGEAKASLLKVKDTVDAYIAAPGEPAPLALAQQLLHEIAGSLGMLSYTRVAQVVRASARYLQHGLMATARLPEQAELDALADALTAIEYFLDAFVEGRVHPGSAVDVAEQAVAALGYPVDALPPEAPAAPEEEAVTGPVVAAEVAAVEVAAAPAVETAVPTAAPPATLPPARAPDIDDEIASIFIEEAEEELAKINELLPRWRAVPDDENALRDLRRSFHTLKGSGRLVGAALLGEFAWAFENMLNRVLDHTVGAGAVMFDLLMQACEALPQLIEQFRSGASVVADVAWLQTAAQALSKPGGEATLSPPAAREIPQAPVAEPAMPAEVETVPPSPPMDPVLFGIYSGEAQTHLATVEEFITTCREQAACRVGEPLIRALHTLHGSSRTAAVAPVAEVSGQLERYAKALHGVSRSVDEEGCAVLEECITLTRRMLGYLGGEGDVPPEHAALLARATALAEAAQVLLTAAEEPESGLAAVLEAATEAPEVLGEETPPATAGEIVAVAEMPEVAEVPETVEEETPEAPAAAAPETVAEEAGAPSLEDILSSITVEELGAEAFAPAAAAQEPAAPPPPPAESPAAPPAPVPTGYDQELLPIFLEEGSEILHASEETLQAWRDQPEDRRWVEALQRQLHTLKGGARMAGVSAVGDLSHVLESVYEDVVDGRRQCSKAMFDLVQEAHDRLSDMLEQVRRGERAVEAEALIGRIESLGTAPTSGEMDAELLGIFLNQAEDILEQCEAQLRAWALEADKAPLLQELERQLHTLKGASRTAGIRAMGDLSHSLESMLTAITDGHVGLSEQLFDLLQQGHDQLAVMVDQLRQGQVSEEASDLIAQVEDLVAREHISTRATVTAPELPAAVPLSHAEEAALAEGNRRRAMRMHQEMVRVRAELLDQLVNFAGEVSIYRSRVQQQVGSAHSTLRELSEVLERMRGQLRQFTIETEAQIQSRYEEAARAGYEEFDPLEFDRFTHMQQLSRSAMESLADLESVRDSLQGVARETETLLVQQGRVNTELQEGLMHTRMVPLVENAPRLRRIVRQTAQELDKEVELRFQGADVEMDRHMVERLLAPLEHLLRNAVAHGIETRAARRAASKPELGRITIAQAREGSEVVLRIFDDGAGIQLEKVRRKAIERGLMDRDADLSDKEVMHFILESGFSTADTLTQVAGRGVGMDVVNSEIKQLGGVLEIATEAGVGTTFTLRLPLTLSVSRALLIRVGEDIYAVPLASIQGIERIKREGLEELLAREHPTYRWLGREHEVLSLSGVLGLPAGALADDEGRRTLLFAHSGDHYVAWVADDLIGSREIVVKSLGPQLSTLRGLSGATILGDGSVALILDLVALARSGLALRAAAPAEATAPQAALPVVMVVDDSITVRKVTTRLLERNDMRAVTAKDGVDAIAQLEEVVPDVMLLDIEMPRMDGYELATHIRNTERFAHIPIVMITSRSGEKHRQRAMEIGVDIYMSKPFQETELLDNIRKLLAGRSAVEGVR